MECACHISVAGGGPKEHDKVFPFTDITWNKALEYVTEWMKLPSEDNEYNISVFISTLSQLDVGFHKKCYQKFTDKQRLERAQKRKTKGTRKRKYVEISNSHVSVTPRKQKRQLRSDQKIISSLSRRSEHVLPSTCIICRREKIVRDYFSKKRERQKLVTCETGNTLKMAAELKEDEDLLIHIRDQDLVSIEVKYHRSCYRSYTRCISVRTKTESKIPYAKSFSHFCTSIIEQRIINGNEIIKLKAAL